jgi:hypothetical protein
MSIEKWLSERESEEIRKKKEELYKQLPKEKKQDLKKKSITKIVANETKSLKSDITDTFLTKVIEFKDWLDGRTYLKGDIDKIIINIQNLNNNIKMLNDVDKTRLDKDKINFLNNLYKEIPPSFLDEKIRVALNKKLRGITRTNSDNYYLRKLKNTVREKLNEAKYYEILKEILES